MKKKIASILLLGISISLCACGEPVAEGESANPWNPAVQEGGSAAGEGSSAVQQGGLDNVEGGSAVQEGDTNTQAGSSVSQASVQGEISGQNSLSLLYDLQGDGLGTVCRSDKGCYYLSKDSELLADGSYASHLMYIDAATRQEIYLCSNAACTHNTADCTSVFLNDEFPPYTTGIFMWNDNLYLMAKKMDQDGSSSTFTGAEGIFGPVESKPATLYRMNPDGTDRRKVYAFDPTVTVEDFALGDEEGLYFITKKLSTQQINGSTYQTAAERKLIYLDVSAKTEKEICSMGFGDNISWNIIGCSGRRLVVCGVDFGRVVSPEELHDDDIRIYDDSDEVFATLNVDDGTLHEFYRVHAPKSRSWAVYGNQLYFSVDGGGCIVRVDLDTGEEKELCRITSNLIWGMIGDRLYCYDSSDSSYRFVNVHTGEISHSRLVNKTTGWSIDLITEIGDQVLVLYDSDGYFKGDGVFHNIRSHYALIDKEDLYAGVEEYAPITMKGGRIN